MNKPSTYSLTCTCGKEHSGKSAQFTCSQCQARIVIEWDYLIRKARGEAPEGAPKVIEMAIRRAA